MRKEEWKRIGYTQSSVPDRKVCDLDPYSWVDKFPIGPIEPAIDWYKQLFDARKIGFGKEKTVINLGGHVFHKPSEMTRFEIIHYHLRCIEIGKYWGYIEEFNSNRIITVILFSSEVENCKRVLERHLYTSPGDSDYDAKTKLLHMLCWGDDDDICYRTKSKGFPSVHKAIFYVKWLQCPETMKKIYYAHSEDAVQLIRGATKTIAPINEYVKNILSTAYQKYGL